MNVNNAIPLQHIHPVQQAEPRPHVAIRIEGDAAAPENALPHLANVRQNRRPAMFNRMAEGLRHGGAQVVGAANFIREHPGVLLAATVVQSTGFMMNMLVRMTIQYGPQNNSAHANSADESNIFNNMPAKILGFGTAGTLLLTLGLDSIRRRANPGDPDAANVELARAAAHLRDEDLAGRPIADVVGDIRGYRGGSSSAPASRSFDWTQAGLFVDRNGIDQTAQVSHLLNRILQNSIKNEDGTISSVRAGLVNDLLDKLETDPEHRSGLANQVLEINAACIDRANVGFNIMMRQLDTHGLENKTPRDVLLHVIGGAVMAAADKELHNHLKKPWAEAYQAVHRLAAEKLRKKIPDFHLKIEDLKYGHSDNTHLTEKQIETIAAKALEQFNNPEQIAQCLLESPAANKQMEDRFAKELAVINKEIVDQLDEKCKQFTNVHERAPSLAEMGQLAVALEPKRQEAIKEYYAQLIADASLFTH